MIWQRSYWVGCYILGTVLTQDGRERYQIYFYPVRNDNSISDIKRWESKIFFFRHRSDHCLALSFNLPFSQSLTLLSKVSHGFLKVARFFCQSCQMHLLPSLPSNCHWTYHWILLFLSCNDWCILHETKYPPEATRKFLTKNSEFP